MNRRLPGLIASLLVLGTSILQAGIPEPGLILYGVVTSTSATNPVWITSGALSWTVQPAVGNPVTVQAALTNINDQFSFVLEVPFETELPGFAASADTLPLTAAPVSHDLSQVTLDGQPATITTPDAMAVLFSKADRGTYLQVDLQIALLVQDTDQDGLPDEWETRFFGNPTIADPGTDSDGDGVDNGDEFLAGTDPRDGDSVFTFIEIRPVAGVGVEVNWAAVSGRTYQVSRTLDLINGPYIPVAAGLAADPPVNRFLDTTATNPVPYFFRIELE